MTTTRGYGGAFRYSSNISVTEVVDSDLHLDETCLGNYNYKVKGTIDGYNACYSISFRIFDTTDQLPIFMDNEGVVPRKDVREYVRNEMIGLISKIGIEKIR